MRPKEPSTGSDACMGTQGVLTAGAGEWTWRVSWGPEGTCRPRPLFLGCSLLSAPARAPLSLHLARAATGPWEGQANITQGDKGGLGRGGDRELYSSRAAETNPRAHRPPLEPDFSE